MAFTSAKMGLRIWNLLTDLYDHTQIADNWAKVDYHDHSPGKGVQIPTEGIADAAITGAKLASAIDPSGAYTTYKVLRASLGAIGSGQAINTYGLSEAFPTGLAATANPGGVWYFDPTEQAVSGRSAKLSISALLTVNSATAPAATFTIAMVPVTAIAAGVLTVGAAITGSTAVFTTPAGNTMTNAVSSDFDPPAAGTYMLTAANSAIPASQVVVRAHLRVHHV